MTGKSECVCCKKFGPVDSCHIKSRGSGGPNEGFNLLSMCRSCHRLQHTVSWSGLLKRYPHMTQTLKSRGWSIEIVMGRFKLWHPRLCGKIQS